VALLVVLLVAGVGAVVLGRQGLDTSSPRHAALAQGSSSASSGVVGTASIVRGTLVQLDRGGHAITFLALGRAPQDGQTYSAQHAYDALLHTPSKLNPIPSTVQAYYGRLTDPIAMPVALGTRVWGFAVESRCVDASHRGGTRSSPSPRPRRCRHWEFVDARTGRDLGVIEQEVLPG